jgi:N-acetylglucosaminylphosphatidylinositol deacetylase
MPRQLSLANEQAITFDHMGITNHPNHTPLPSSLLALSTLPDAYSAEVSIPLILTLKSPRTITKFTGPLYPFFKAYTSHFPRIFHSNSVPGGKGQVIDVVASPFQWVSGWKAMLRHKSQLVWFRWLYLLFSRLMWLNELVVVS